MFLRDFFPGQFLHSVYGTVPFVEYCRQRGVPFEQNEKRPRPADALERWMSALAELPRGSHAAVELDLAKVNELSAEGAMALLLQAAGPGPIPPDSVPSGAPVSLWFLLHRPDVFHEVLMRHESGECMAWRTVRVAAGLPLRNLRAKAVDLETELRGFFRRSDASNPPCAVDARCIAGGYYFTAQVAERLRFLQLFTDDGRVGMRRVRPALPVAFAYYPDSGTALLGSPLRPGDRAEELLRRVLQAVLGVAPLDDGVPYDLDPLKGPFRPLPDADDMESVRVRALHLRSPGRTGRRTLRLETLSKDGPFAVEEMLRAHLSEAILPDLRVCYAELQVRMRVEGGSRTYVIRLWPDRSNLGPTAFGDRLRACLRRWGLCHVD